MKHTKGPWIISDAFPSTEGMVILDQDGFPIADLDIEPILEGYAEKLGINHWGNDPRATKERAVEEIEANARLIAAAPDLYAALLGLMNAPQDIDRPEYKAALAAIGKVEGK